MLYELLTEQTWSLISLSQHLILLLSWTRPVISFIVISKFIKD